MVKSKAAQRDLLVACIIGFLLGVGTATSVRKASDGYDRVTDRLERIEAYIGQLDRMIKSR